MQLNAAHSAHSIHIQLTFIVVTRYISRGFQQNTGILVEELLRENALRIVFYFFHSGKTLSRQFVLLAHVSLEMICASFLFISLPRRTINVMNVGRPKKEKERKIARGHHPPSVWDDGRRDEAEQPLVPLFY